MDDDQEGVSAFGIAGRNVPPALDVEKSISHQMPQFLEVPIIGARLFAIAARRNLRLHALSTCSRMALLSYLLSAIRCWRVPEENLGLKGEI